MVILNLVLLTGLLVSRVEKHVQGVWRLELVGRCYLDFPTPALACPGVDYIRLWPMPVEQPWQETLDPDWLPGGYARR